MANRPTTKQSRYESANNIEETSTAKVGDKLRECTEGPASKDVECADEAEEQLNKMQAITANAATIASTMGREMKRKDKQICTLTTQMAELTKAIASLRQDQNVRGEAEAGTGVQRDSKSRKYSQQKVDQEEKGNTQKEHWRLLLVTFV